MGRSERRTLTPKDLNLEIPDFTFRPNVWIDARILPIAKQNIEKRVPKFKQRVTLLQSDLLESVPSDYLFDVICGCLPQVSKPATIKLGDEDSFARYFDAVKYQSVLNVYGLGLNEAVLILVLSGRAGKSVLEELFTHNGYTPRIVFEDNIAQLRETTFQGKGFLS